MLPPMMSTEIDDDSEIIGQLKFKEKFHASANKSQKVQILTILPKSWSVIKVQEEFEASNYMTGKAKKLLKEQGIFSSSNPKHSFT